MSDDCPELFCTMTVAVLFGFENCVLYVVADVVAGLSKYDQENPPLLSTEPGKLLSPRSVGVEIDVAPRSKTNLITFPAEPELLAQAG